MRFQLKPRVSLLSSSPSTKLTVDTGSLQSVNVPSARAGQTLGRMSAPSAHPAVDDARDDTPRAADVVQYLEISPTPERCRYNEVSLRFYCPQPLKKAYESHRVFFIRDLRVSAAPYRRNVLLCPSSCPPLWPMLPPI